MITKKFLLLFTLDNFYVTSLLCCFYWHGERLFEKQIPLRFLVDFGVDILHNNCIIIKYNILLLLIMYNSNNNK